MRRREDEAEEKRQKRREEAILRKKGVCVSVCKGVCVLGVRILCSKIMELCYALMLTLYPYYAPQTDHYAP